LPEAPPTPSAPPPKSKKKKSQADVQRELRELSKPATARPPLDLKKTYIRVGLVVAGVWILAGGVATFVRPWIPLTIAGVLTLAVAGAAVWVMRLMKKNEALTAILADTESDEGRKRAIEKLNEFGKGDAQALLARANLEMQEDPRKALATLESIDLTKTMLGGLAAQVRATRAQIHLMIGEPAEARKLADDLDLGKQEDPKLRAMLATVAAEAWARTGAAKKAVETLELFNPDDPEFAELRTQMWRARAFAYAATNDSKGVGRALRKLAELNAHLLSMFINQKRIHPLLEREAKQIIMKMGVVPRKVVRQRM